MPIKHCPDPATLMTCAAGSQPEALCAVVISHLSLCKTCMDEVVRMEMIGTALLAQIEPATTTVSAPARVTRAPFQQDTLLYDGTPSEIPSPLRAAVGHEIDVLQWHSVSDGVSSCRVPMSPEAQGELILVKLEPGVELPERQYEGEELLLVLRGTCVRDGASLERGDYAEFYDGTAHGISASETAGCIVLIAYERLPHQISQPGQRQVA